MTFNLRHSDNPGIPDGNRRGAQIHPMTRKAQGVLRAYIGAPGGLGVEAVYRYLSTLDPLPTYREAIHLTEKIPSLAGARVLARYFAFLQAVERIQAQREEARSRQAFKPAQALVTPDRTAALDWAPVQEGRAR